MDGEPHAATGTPVAVIAPCGTAADAPTAPARSGAPQALPGPLRTEADICPVCCHSATWVPPGPAATSKQLSKKLLHPGMSFGSSATSCAADQPPPLPAARSALFTRPGGAIPSGLAVSPQITVNEESGLPVTARPVRTSPGGRSATGSCGPHGPPGGRRAATTQSTFTQTSLRTATTLPSGAAANTCPWLPVGRNSSAPNVSDPGGLV